MDLSGRQFVNIPGDQVFELPPLLFGHQEMGKLSRSRMLTDARDILAYEQSLDWIHMGEDQTYTQALNITETYTAIYNSWIAGDTILRWIIECENDFTRNMALRHLVSQTIWPRASRSSFVTLLEDKQVMESHLAERAVGLRLAFRKLPPIDCCTQDFVYYLASTLGTAAFNSWSGMVKPSYLPAERFHIQIVKL